MSRSSEPLGESQAVRDTPEAGPPTPEGNGDSCPRASGLALSRLRDCTSPRTRAAGQCKRDVATCVLTSFLVPPF